MTQDQVSQLLAAVPADKVAKINWSKVIDFAQKFLPVILSLLQEIAPIEE